MYTLIVHLDSRYVVGVEALGRLNLTKLPPAVLMQARQHDVSHVCPRNSGVYQSMPGFWSMPQLNAHY
eukprot:8285814-Pyramimonas_sp.AAC.1